MTSSKSKTNRFSQLQTNANMNELQFRLDIDGDDEYVDEEIISINGDYLSVSSASTTTSSTSFETKKTKKHNFFTLTTTTAQQAARHLIKLFTSNKKQKTITTITRTTTTTTTLKAAIKQDEEFTDDEYIIEDDENNSNKKEMKLRLQQRVYHKTNKQHQMHHRIPFHQKVNTKNFKSIQVKLDRFSINCLSNLNTGLGFTIVGYCPCQIGKVEVNSIAYNAGLIAGDLIIKINGKNVSRATCDSIVKIIKNLNDQFLVLDIYRVMLKKAIKNSFVSSFNTKNEQKVKSSRIKCNKKIPIQQQQSHYHINNTNHVSSSVATKLKQKRDISSTNIIRSKTAAFLKEQQYHHRQFITMNNKYIQSIKQQEIFNNKDNQIKRDQHEDELILAEAEAAAVVVAAAATVTSSTSAILSLPSPIPYLPPIKHVKQLADSDTSTSSVDDEDDEYEAPKYNHHGYYYLNKKRSSITDSDYKTQSSTTATDNDAESPNQEQLIQQHQLQDEKYLDLDGHMNECEQLFRLEEEFISLMQSGVQQYSRPLRHLMMISQLEHHLLFQNIEKILVLSEYQLNQLISHDESTLIEMFNTIGKLYENKMRMSCEAFDIYLNGIENSFNLLISLIKNNSSNKKFNKFLYESKTEMDLKTFLLLPLYYVSTIHKLLKQIRTKITNTNCDYIPLSNLINSLETHVNKSNLILSKYDNEMNKNPLCNLNKDGLVHTGTLRYKHKLVNLNLFKDRLQMISSELNETIELHNIIKFNFNLANKLEFQISYLNSNDDSSQSFNTIRLRAQNMSEKQEWNKLLSEI